MDRFACVLPFIIDFIENDTRPCKEENGWGGNKFQNAMIHVCVHGVVCWGEGAVLSSANDFL